MPLYEFRCTPCESIFEVWRTMSESSLPAHCPDCQEAGKRVISAPAVNLSGTLPIVKRGAEPQLVQREVREPAKPKFQAQSCGRPWMLNH